MENELEILENEIRSLQEQIGPLQAELGSLLRQAAQIDSESRTGIAYNAQNKILQPQKDVLPQDEHEEAPPVYHYNYFDESIQKYFKELTITHENADYPELSHQILAHVEARSNTGLLQLAENIFRFGGITAFPINERLYDSEDCSLLGVRFDVMDYTKKQYIAPFYIILRQKKLFGSGNSADKFPWTVFRYTTPAYVPLDQISKLLDCDDPDAGLSSFVEMVRLKLVDVQTRREYFESLKTITFADLFGDTLNKPIAEFEMDAACIRVTIKLNNSCKIELFCEKGEVVGIMALSLESEDEGALKDQIIKTKLSQLKSTIENTFRYLRSIDKI